MSVRKRLFNSVRALFCSQALNAAIQILALPIFLSIFGEERYGEWLMLSAFASAIAMSDIGIATATANAMTLQVGAGSHETAQKIYESGWYLLTVFSSIFTILLLFIVWCFPFVEWMGFHGSSTTVVKWTITMLAVQTFIAVQTTSFFASFRSIGELATVINLASLQRLLEFVAQIVAIYYFRTILAAAVAGLIVRVLEYVMAWQVQRRIIPWLQSTWSTIELKIRRELFRPALASMAFPFGQILSNQGILLLIGSLLGPAAVSIFTAHRTIANIALQVVQSISQAALPEFSLAFGSGDPGLAKRLHRRICQLSLGLGLFSCIAIGVIANPWTKFPLIEIWTGGKINMDYALLLALLTWVAVRSLWFASLFVSMSVNLHHRIAVVFVVGTFGSLIAAIPLTQLGGLAGTVIALLLTDVLMSFVVLRSAFRLVGDSASSFWGFVTGYGS